LTVRLNKRADDVFTAGTYAGSFTINYTDGSRIALFGDNNIRFG